MIDRSYPPRNASKGYLGTERFCTVVLPLYAALKVVKGSRKRAGDNAIIYTIVNSSDFDASSTERFAKP